VARDEGSANDESQSSEEAELTTKETI